jgi:NSS family neurotransmitter:Na+ symporter
MLGTVSMLILGITASLSWGVMSDVKIFGLNVFTLFNNTTANILLPLGGFLIVIFLGWFFPSSHVRDELSNGGKLKARYYTIYRLVIKFLAPVAIAMVFLHGLGLLKF